MGEQESAGLREDWALLVSFLPANWRDLAESTGALKGLRKDKSPENLLRVLLLHLACGHSLRETAARARNAELAHLSSVALWKRLRKSQEWLRALCVELLSERGVQLAGREDQPVRAVDAATVREPGKSGSLWRIHYSVALPAMACDFFRLTEANGTGTRKTFRRFPILPGDSMLADRDYSTADGIAYVAQAGGRVTVRLDNGSLPFQSREGVPFDLLKNVRALSKAGGGVRAWQVKLEAPQGPPVPGRICAVRKTQEAIEIAQERSRTGMREEGRRLRPQVLEVAKCVIVFTTLPERCSSAADVLELYRLHWQIRLVFNRFKSLAQLGHLPKQDDASAKAWLYGKLLVALLVEKLIDHARTVSPWGYRLAPHDLAQR